MEKIREGVQKHYGEIARQIQTEGQSCCCGPSSSCCSPITRIDINYHNEDLSALPAEALQASLGCANPHALAGLKEGETVLDLGSGGGIDVLVASRYVGPTGKVYGLDMTDEMLALANSNKERMGAANVEFLKGYIEEIPLPDESVDVVMSNCVINLSGDKVKVMSEIYRVLKPGGRLAIADIVSTREVPAEIRQITSLWVSCIAGSLSVQEYQELLAQAGFNQISVTPENYYTREVLQGLGADDASLTEAQWEMADAAFAGALIKAVKEAV
ncbi:MAG TPA: arsenite methyltransferase [Syntrophomonadaceae bacterium]|mgnify:CR=1 FL=1|nr:arsenite methyltransferase [Syntrophomonadaceae bacterium]